MEFKPTGWGRLIYSVDTRFGTYFDVVGRLLSSVKEVTTLVKVSRTTRKPNITAQTAFKYLLRGQINGDVTYPALDALFYVFTPILEMYISMEANTKPAIHHLLPRLHFFKCQLQSLKLLLPVVIFPSSARTSPAALEKILDELNKIRLYYLWAAACTSSWIRRFTVF